MTRSLRIAIVAPPWNKIPPDNYGGTEQIVDIQCRGFKAAGHSPVLFCSADSSCPVERHSVINTAQMPPDKYKEHIHFASFLEAAGSMEFDVIHTHLEGLMPYSDRFSCPVFCTLHVEVTPERKDFISYNNNVHFIAISNDQASRFPMKVDVIHHGMELDTFPFVDRIGNYLFYVGEICERKGVDRAAMAAQELGIPLKIAGYLHQDNELWFEEKVLSRGSGREIEYLGRVSQKDKLDLIGNARALLCPVRWNEPFGLVAIEGLACGTPVIAMANGSFPELIENGVSGFVSETVEEFISLVSKADQLLPSNCRKAAEEKFNHVRMINQYLDAFNRVL